MNPILRRLGNVSFAVLAPSAAAAYSYTSVIDPQRYESLLGGLKALKARVTPTGGQAAPNDLPDIDRVSWQILALDRNGVVIGAVRFYHWGSEPITGERLVAMGRVHVAAGWQRAQLINALDAHFAVNAACRTLVGGMLTASEWLGTALPSALGLGAVALAESLGLEHGLTFATLHRHVDQFYEHFGATDVCVNGQPVVFHVLDRGQDFKLQALHVLGYEPRFAEIVSRMRASLTSTPAVTPF